MPKRGPPNAFVSSEYFDQFFAELKETYPQAHVNAVYAYLENWVMTHEGPWPPDNPDDRANILWGVTGLLARLKVGRWLN